MNVDRACLGKACTPLVPILTGSCLRSCAMQVALLAIGILAILFAFSHPMSYSDHVGAIVGGSLALTGAVLGFILNQCTKRNCYRKPVLAVPDIIEPSPRARTSSSAIDYSTAIASAIKPPQPPPVTPQPTSPGPDVNYAVTVLNFDVDAVDVTAAVGTVPPLTPLPLTPVPFPT